MVKLCHINKVAGLSSAAFSRKLGEVSTSIDPVSAGTGLITSIGNWISQSKNRKLQKKMFEAQLNTQVHEAALNRNFQQNSMYEQMDFDSRQARLAYERQLQLQQQQQAYNTQERLSAQQFNSAPAQAERLRAAGLNPQLNMSSSTPVSAASSSLGSAPSASSSAAPGAQASPVPMPTLQAPQLDFTSLLTSLYYGKQKEADIRASNATADILSNDALHRDLFNFYTIQKLIADGKLSGVKREVEELERNFIKKTFNDRATLVNESIENQRAARLYQAANTRLLDQQTEYQRLVNLNLPREYSLKFASYIAGIKSEYQLIQESKSRVSLNSHQARVYDSQAKSLQADFIETMTRAYRNGYRQNGTPHDYRFCADLAREEWRRICSEANRNNRTTFLHGYDINYGGEVGANGSFMGVKAGANGKIDVRGKNFEYR